MGGHFLRTVSNLAHVEEPVMKGHGSSGRFLLDKEMSPEARFYCDRISCQ